MKHKLYDREDGLHHCQICGGAEIDLTYHCPGRNTTEDERTEIANGRLQYLHRKWWMPSQPDPLAEFKSEDLQDILEGMGTEDQTVDVGVALIESTAGYVCRLIRAIQATRVPAAEGAANLKNAFTTMNGQTPQ